MFLDDVSYELAPLTHTEAFIKHKHKRLFVEEMSMVHFKRSTNAVMFRSAFECGLYEQEILLFLDDTLYKLDPFEAY